MGAESNQYAGDIVALYDHWLRTCEAKGIEDCHREALWHVAITINAALTGKPGSDADLRWREAFSRQGASLIRRAVAEAAQRQSSRAEPGP